MPDPHSLFPRPALLRCQKTQFLQVQFSSYDNARDNGTLPLWWRDRLRCLQTYTVGFPVQPGGFPLKAVPASSPMLLGGISYQLVLKNSGRESHNLNMVSKCGLLCRAFVIASPDPRESEVTCLHHLPPLKVFCFTCKYFTCHKSHKQ